MQQLAEHWRAAVLVVAGHGQQRRARVPRYGAQPNLAANLAKKFAIVCVALVQ